MFPVETEFFCCKNSTDVECNPILFTILKMLFNVVDIKNPMF